MKKKIAILGSTGSIGKSLINVIKKDKKNFEIILLTAHKNYKEVLKQANFFNVKNIIITNKENYEIALEKNLNNNIKIFNNYNIFKNIFKNKLDYSMSSISGLNGLVPTLDIIKYTKKIAIANKESIICGWNLISNELKKYKTSFVPVDSEHFTIWKTLNNNSSKHVEQVYLTASGGPLLNTPLNQLKDIKISQALKHPNWKMGKKISIDSATMMNKVFEIIEAKNIFEIAYKKLNILVHPDSYIHSIIKFNDGLTKLIAHDTTMEIPIFNSLYSDYEKKFHSKKIDLKKLNNLRLQKVDIKKFPLIKILKIIPEHKSLFETVIVSANDEFVNLYLKDKIKFTDISERMIKFLNLVEFSKYKKIKSFKIKDINKLSEYVRFKINAMSI